MANRSASSQDAFARRDRPWLLPSNRKLRNLISISLRNLSLSAPTSLSRPRGKTIDDDALPNTLKSPAKLVALRERALGHSRSSSDLRTVAEDGESAVDIVNGSPKKAKPKTPQRPVNRMRRRSTLEWVNATPQRRQEKLENVTAERLVDVFFSLHIDDIQEPLYISETVERTMNPTFRHIDLSLCGPAISRLDHLIIKVWVRSVKSDQWQQLLALSLQMSKLQYLGKSLDHFHHALPQNAVIFRFSDGVYIHLASLADFVPPPMAPMRASSTRILPTSSFDALLRLSKLDDSVQDALATRNSIAADLEALLESNSRALAERDQIAEAEDRLKTIDFAKKTVEKQLEKARKQQLEKRRFLEKRRELMSTDSNLQTVALASIREARPELPISRDEHEVKQKAIRNQRRRICEDVHKCYPIQPITGKSLAFSIRDLHLPNSEELDTETPDIIAATLGHVAHLLLLLSFYLGQPLPYPVSPRSSSSTIEDPVSLLKTNASTTQTYKDEKSLRTYPLFTKGVPRFRFEYGVFCLNKNIQVLLESAYNVRVLDIRQTLPNLKYLLYVATAGEGELPARKAGGVRGLLQVKEGRRGEAVPTLNRTGSSDSVSSAMSGILWHNGHAANGKPKSAVESLKKSMSGLEVDGKKAG